MNFLNNKLTFKNVIPFIIPIIIMIILIIIGAFYDLDINNKVAVLSNGNYYTDSFFARFFEQIGQLPVYLAMAIGMAFLLRGVEYLKNKPLKIVLAILFMIGLVAAYTLMTKRNLKYHAEMYGIYGWHESHNLIVYVMSFLLSIIPTVITLLLVNRIKTENIMKYVFLGLVLVLAAGLSQILVQGIKLIGARLRYRAMYVLEYNGYLDQAIYYPLFKFAPSRVLTDEMINLGFTKDVFKSFPSGHACAACMIMALVFIPTILEFEGKKKLISSIVLWCVASSYLILVCYARLVAGAHYLTDVCFGSLATYLCILFSFLMIKRLAIRISKLIKIEKKVEE